MLRRILRTCLPPVYSVAGRAGTLKHVLALLAALAASMLAIGPARASADADPGERLPACRAGLLPVSAAGLPGA